MNRAYIIIISVLGLFLIGAISGACIFGVRSNTLSGRTLDLEKRLNEANRTSEDAKKRIDDSEKIIAGLRNDLKASRADVEAGRRQAEIVRGRLTEIAGGVERSEKISGSIEDGIRSALDIIEKAGARNPGP